MSPDGAGLMCLVALATCSGCAITQQNLGANDDAGMADGGGVDGGTPAPQRIAAGSHSTMVLAADGRVWAWGANLDGQLALPLASTPDACTINTRTGPCASEPIVVPALEGARDLAMGMDHGCALREGRVVCWGLNLFGMLGDGSFDDNAGPTPVDVGISDAIAVAAGDYTSCAIHADGTVSCWGFGGAGMLGIEPAGLDSCNVSPPWVARHGLPFPGGASLPCTLSPRRVPGLMDVASLALGRTHLCAVRGDASVVCMGSAEAGQLGNGVTTGISSAPVPTADGISALAAGSLHSCGLRGAEVLCWGDNGFAQSGAAPAPATCSAAPCVPTASVVPPFGAGTPSATAAGAGHTCVIVGTEAWCFGSADDGAAGPRNETCERGPCRVPAGRVATDVRAPIGAGGSHTCTSALDGAIMCWGTGAAGELGDGLRTASATPVRVVLPTR